MNAKMLWLSRQLASSDKTTVTGFVGERVVMEHLSSSDWHTHQAASVNCGDVIATNRVTGETLRLEIKTAKKAKNGQYQFCITKADKHGATDYRHSDVVILICVDAAGGFYLYVIPASSLKLGQQRLSISSHPTVYNGKYSCFRQRWLDFSNCLSDMTAIH